MIHVSNRNRIDAGKTFRHRLFVELAEAIVEEDM